MRSVFILVLGVFCISLTGCFDNDNSDDLTTKDVALRISLLPVFNEYTEREIQSDVSAQVILKLKKGKELFKIDVSKLSILGETSAEAHKRTINAKPAFSTLVVEKDDFGLGEKSAQTSLFGGKYKVGDNKAPKYYQLHIFQEPFHIEVFRADFRQVGRDLRRARYKSNTALMREVARQMDSLPFLKVGKTLPEPDVVPSVMKTPEVTEFCGKNDTRIPKASWPAMIEMYARDTLAVAKEKIDTKKLEFAGHPLDPELLLQSQLLVPGSDLFEITGMNTVPSSVRETNIFAAASAGVETALAAKIIRSPPQSLAPADVLALALEASDGNYALAVAAANGVLKEATMLARREIHTTSKAANEYKTGLLDNPQNKSSVSKVYGKMLSKAQKAIKHQNRIVIPLKGLRPKETKLCDKMGVWYHIFTILTIGAVSNASQAEIAQQLEHAAKSAKYFANEGGYNQEKSYVDGVFSKIVAGGVKQHFRESLKR